MKVFVAGGGGAVGKRLVPLLVEAGHEVAALTRSPAREPDLLAASATRMVADGLDRDAVIAAVRDAEPEVVVHQMTALAGGSTFAGSTSSSSSARPRLWSSPRSSGRRTG